MVRAGLLLAIALVQCRAAPAPEGRNAQRVPESRPASAAAQRNVYGAPLALCSTQPLTGWRRDGYCKTDDADRGTHVVCAEVTQRFLEFTRSRGNDLTTPRPEHRFAGLRPGDRWCLCAFRRREALDAGVAPPVIAAATHQRALSFVGAESLRAHERPAH